MQNSIKENDPSRHKEVSLSSRYALTNAQSIIPTAPNTSPPNNPAAIPFPLTVDAAEVGFVELELSVADDEVDALAVGETWDG